MIWLPATLLAGLFQAWRTAVQQRVRAELSVNAAGLVRYLYGLPVGIVLLGLYLAVSGKALPYAGSGFLPWAAAGGFAQIVATNFLLMAFGYRNYVVGTAYAKTEAIQGAILSAVLLGEWLSPLSLLGIGFGVAGVVLLSTGGERLKLADLGQPAALCGLAAGFGFTLTSIFVKKATLTLATPDKVFAALVTLVVVQACQTLMQGGYVLLRERDQLRPVLRTWRTSGQVGLLAALGSACWFTGFATANVALVRTVGQVEVIFVLLFGHYYLNERFSRTEALSLLLVGLGVLTAIAGA
jgi:drug/metabolite transporter (DMT)-like permease